MIRTLRCSSALLIAALGSLPASATDQPITIAMHEPMAARHVQDIKHATLNATAPAISNVRAAIEIDPTSAADYSYRGQFQAERGFLELALDDLSTAARLARDSRDDIQQKILMRAFAPTEAADAAGLDDGFSRVAYYR